MVCGWIGYPESLSLSMCVYIYIISLLFILYFRKLYLSLSETLEHMNEFDPHSTFCFSFFTKCVDTVLDTRNGGHHRHTLPTDTIRRDNFARFVQNLWRFGV